MDEIKLPEFRVIRKKVLTKPEVLLLLEQGDNIIAWKKHRFSKVYRCSMQKAMQTLKVQTFMKLLEQGKLEETFRPDFDGTTYYKLKETTIPTNP